MRIGFAIRTALAAMLLGTSAGAQQGVEHRSLVVGDVTLDVAVPQGFCVAEGKAGQIAEHMAAGDTRNKTIMTIVTCGDTSFAPDYFVIKLSGTYRDTTVDRAQFMQQVTPVFTRPEYAGIFASTAERSSKMLSAVHGTPITVVGKIEPLGIDDQCAFVGGTLSEENMPVQTSAGCITVIAGKVLMIYSSEHGERAGDVRHHIDLARSLAGAISRRRS